MTAFAQETIVANCCACVLAETMMLCPICPFFVGKAVRVVVLETIRLHDPVEQEKFWVTLPKWLWEAYHKYITPTP